MRSRWRPAWVLGTTLALLVGCGVGIPVDPDGTLDRVRGGNLRVGVSPNAPWTDVHDGSEPTGIEVELVREFAARLDAELHWTEGGEQLLVGGLENGSLDLVIGGLHTDTPWTEKAAMTRPFSAVAPEHGASEEHVMAVRMGENAFLVELETFLAETREQQ